MTNADRADLSRRAGPITRSIVRALELERAKEALIAADVPEQFWRHALTPAIPLYSVEAGE